MSDQNGGKTETSEADSRPRSSSDAPSGSAFGEHHVPPVIEGEAFNPTAEHKPDPSETRDSAASAELESDPDHDRKAESRGEAKAEAGHPATDDSPRRGGALRPVALLIGAVALGGGAYYLWDAYVATPPAPPARIALTPPAAERIIPPVAAPEPPPREAAAKMPEAAPAPVAEASKQAEIKPTESKAAETAPDAASPEADKAVADMAAKLAAAQAAVERLTQRLQTVEGQLAAPKDSARATLSTREAGPGNAGEAAARLVVAQSLQTALRQGDDYSAQLAALQNFGGDPARLARLRAGLSAPTLSRLTTEFTALAPKIAAAVAPARPAEDSATPQGARESVLAYLQAQARKLVRIRPAGAPDKDATALQIEKIEKELRSGDLAAALADRQQLPAPALAVSADWARLVQTRLDAETAARAELTDALQNLTKTKS
ncbi:hypothetical protein QM467_09755 [Rhodoblastus sp. 17X3]|uniref:hypothetical protein n=1 Tax=Rhodoblastus sp. 17X3 TaxID=3047026 RepID=UPI0024B663A6|nr:hypothetical protein [Rhodoblastus sp. 17X3]MDI9848336.1 hypothetical protein [Rhodoblastus sp. 17X3]